MTPLLETHLLENGRLRLEVAPHLGASIVNLQANVGGEWQPILRRTSPQTLARGSASNLASFTLAPFSNRIPEAKFTFEEQEYQLRPTTPEGNAQHGDVRNRPHEVIEQTSTDAAYKLDSRDFDDFNFPFPFTLETRFELKENAVRQTLSLTNVGAKRMPAGMGLHPYFGRHLAGAADVELSFHAQGYYPTDASLVPSGPMQPIPAELDFDEPRLVGNQQLNTGYGGYAGLASLRYVGTPYQVEMRSDPVFSHLVVFTAPDGTLALEPVSHATDAFNLAARGMAGVGFRVLEPGEALRGGVEFRFGEDPSPPAPPCGVLRALP